MLTRQFQSGPRGRVVSLVRSPETADKTAARRGCSESVPDVDVVTVSYNAADLLAEALSAYSGSTGVRVRSIVVDNASEDGSAAVASGLGATVHVLDTNVGYGAAFNHGLDRSTAEFVVCANQDVRVQPGAIASLVAAVRDHETGCRVPCVVGARLVTVDGSTSETCHRVPTLGKQTLGMLLGDRVAGARNAYPDGPTNQHCGWVSAAFILARREVFLGLGGFDPSYFMYVEDLDFFTRLARDGGHCVWVPSAKVVHVRTGGGVGTPLLHAHALWGWKRYFTVHGPHAGRVAGETILYAGIVGSLLRGAMWWLRARRETDSLATQRASLFLRGGLLALISALQRQPPPVR